MHSRAVSLPTKLALEPEHRQPRGAAIPPGPGLPQAPSRRAQVLLGEPAPPLPHLHPPGKSKGSTWWLRPPPAPFPTLGAAPGQRQHGPGGVPPASSPGSREPSWLPTRKSPHPWHSPHARPPAAHATLPGARTSRRPLHSCGRTEEQKPQAGGRWARPPPPLLNIPPLVVSGRSSPRAPNGRARHPATLPSCIMASEEGPTPGVSLPCRWL